MGEGKGVSEITPPSRKQFCISGPLSNFQTGLDNPQKHPNESPGIPWNLQVSLVLVNSLSIWIQMCYYSQVNRKKYILSQLLKLRITAVENQVYWLFLKGRVKTKEEISTGFDEAGLYFLSGIQFQFKAERTLSLKILGDLVKIPEDWIQDYFVISWL